MKILIVTNLYPPHYVGGYELHCSQVAEWLQREGHEVRVLTSTYRLPGAASPVEENDRERVNGVVVERALTYYPCHPSPKLFYAPRIIRRQIKDAARFMQILREFRPDVVNWWNLEGLTKAILPIPGAQGIADACCLDDVWLIREFGVSGEKENLGWFRYWRGDWGPVFLRPLLRPLLARRSKAVERSGIPTRISSGIPSHACFMSEFLRFEHLREGFAFRSSEVIYGGVDPDRFCAGPRKPLRRGDGLRLLYAGYVEQNRGLHTIIEALGLLPLEHLARTRLSIVPSGPPEPTPYVKKIKEQIRHLGLSEHVKFLEKRNHDEMARVYQDHDLLIFASVRPEGLGLVMIEALCAGCAVVTTGSGGAIEIADAAGLPVFPQEHPLALSRLLAKLITAPEIVSEIGSRGQQVVLDRFTHARKMGEISRMFARLSERKEFDPKSIEPIPSDPGAQSVANELGI